MAEHWRIYDRSSRAAIDTAVYAGHVRLGLSGITERARLAYIIEHLSSALGSDPVPLVDVGAWSTMLIDECRAIGA